MKKKICFIGLLIVLVVGCNGCKHIDETKSTNDKKDIVIGEESETHDNEESKIIIDYEKNDTDSSIEVAVPEDK